MKRLWWILAGLLLFSEGSVATELNLATNLQQLGEQAREENIPIAILFTYKGIHSGVQLKEQALLPELRSGELDGFALFREIEVNAERTIIDFYGEPTPSSEFQQMYNLTNLPVMIFVNGDGEPIADPLFSGAYEYYGFYLKGQINEALKALGNPKRVPQ